jgi:tetraacyldisaccharide-1-P 4'-kinase
VVYNAQGPCTHWEGEVAQRRISSIQRLDDWRASKAAPDPEGTVPMDEVVAHLKSQGDITMAAGIAVPQRFFSMVVQCGLAAKALPLPDHDPWTHVEVAGAGPVLVTEKDAVKILPDHPLAPRVWVATLDFKLPETTVNTLVGWLGQRPAP